MATVTINTVYCIQASTGIFIPADFLNALQNLADTLVPNSVAEVIDATAGVVGGLVSAVAGDDNLYISADGVKIWPVDAEAVDINTGDTRDVFVDFDFAGQQLFSLREMDGDFADPGDDEDDDDNLGSFMVDEGVDPSQVQIAKLVRSDSEGSAYYVFYQLN